MSIFNALGQKVRTLINAKQLNGNQSVGWNSLNDAGESHDNVRKQIWFKGGVI